MFTWLATNGGCLPLSPLIITNPFEIVASNRLLVVDAEHDDAIARIAYRYVPSGLQVRLETIDTQDLDLYPWLKHLSRVPFRCSLLALSESYLCRCMIVIPNQISPALLSSDGSRHNIGSRTLVIHG